MRSFDHLRQFLDDDDAKRVEDLRGLVRAKIEMDAHYTLQKALRWWLYGHIPVAVALAVLVLFHVWTVFYY